jgi:hypothetical protein
MPVGYHVGQVLRRGEEVGVSDEERVEYSVKGQFDLSAVDLEAEVPLRVAAVRDGEILTSETLSPKKRLPYDLRFHLPFPCGFRIVLGRAEVPDAVFLATELAAQWVPPRSAKSKGNPTLSFELEPIAVEAARYKLWLLWCRRFRVHGRVVCRNWHWNGHHFALCDDPVPGATVEIHDVDCLWWFCRRDVITTVTTAPDGTFEAEFWWCCGPWRPWYPLPWELDPGLLDRIRRLVEEVRPVLPIPLPDPPPDPFQLQQFVDTLGTALQLAGPPNPMLASAGITPLAETEIARHLPADDLVAAHVWPWWPRRDCTPDVNFRVTQECRGETQVIYDETSWQTRWNIGTDLGVTLVTNEKACCIPVCEDPPCGDCVKWGQVGCLPVQYIGGNDPLTPVAADLLGLAYPGNHDLSFARSLSIDAVFGDVSDVDYYEIEYSRDGGPFTPLPLNTLGSFTRVFWGPPCGVVGPSQWNNPSFPVYTKQDAANVDHFVYESRDHFERNCDETSWGNVFFPGGGRFWTSNRDRILEWVTATITGRTAGHTPPDGFGEMTETPLLQDGLYVLRVIGWKEDGAGNLVDSQVMKRCNTNDEEHLIIRLDNRTMPNHSAFAANHPWGPGFVHFGTRDPDCDITSIVKNEGPNQVIVAPCDIVELANTDSLTIHFTVTVPAPDTDRHLAGYWMQVHHSESAVFDAIAAAVGGAPQADPTIAVGPTYDDTLSVAQGGSRRWWGGGSYKLTLMGSAFPETCAYLFRLHAWKRVWSGCWPIEWFHYNDTETSITINKV